MWAFSIRSIAGIRTVTILNWPLCYRPIRPRPILLQGTSLVASSSVTKRIPELLLTGTKYCASIRLSYWPSVRDRNTYITFAVGP
jgi:hypothetical protein